jgi:hypothetical protein
MPAFPSTFGSDCSGQYFPVHIVTIEALAKIERGQAVNFLGLPHDGSVPASSGAEQLLGLAMADAGKYDPETGAFIPQPVAVCRSGSFTARCKESFSPGDYVWSDSAGNAIQGSAKMHYGQAFGFAQPGGMLEVLLNPGQFNLNI